MNKETVNRMLASRALVVGIVFTLIGILMASAFGVLSGGFFLVVGVSFIVAEFVDRAITSGVCEDSGTLSTAASGVFMVLFGLGIIGVFALMGAPSPILHPFADMTPETDVGWRSNVPAIFGWSIPVLFGLWGVRRLFKSELDLRGRIGSTERTEE